MFSLIAIYMLHNKIISRATQIEIVSYAVLKNLDKIFYMLITTHLFYLKQ